VTVAEPILTVLMTVRNGEPYLREAVASILHQTYSAFRFLILDNASTDNSRKSIRVFKDSRIELVELPEDIGQVVALNRGLQMIDTPLVARMDADDLSLPQRLEKQMLYMAQRPQVVLLGTWCQSIDEVGNLVSRFYPPTSHQAIIDAFATYNPFAHSSVLFRCVPVQEMGGYPADYSHAQDNALWLRLSRQYQVANLPEELVQIRIHPGQTSLSTDMRTARRWDALRLFQQAMAHPGLSPQARRAGRRTVARAMLDYAEALSDERRPGAALRWVSTVCLRYPHLCVWDFGIMVKTMRLLVGRRGRELGRSVKKRLSARQA